MRIVRLLETSVNESSGEFEVVIRTHGAVLNRLILQGEQGGSIRLRLGREYVTKIFAPSKDVRINFLAVKGVCMDLG